MHLLFAILLCISLDHSATAATSGTLPGTTTPKDLATAGTSAPATKEPERFAFIMGNGRYQRAGSNLDDLVDACDEAIQFRKQLLKMGWKADHLYPLVPSGISEDDQDVVSAVVCDQTSHQMQKGLLEFTQKMLLNQNNPYGVIYFAGHGAQSNDDFYAFGVDATVDLNTETQLLLQSTNYEVFSRPPSPGKDGPTAVNLTSLAATVNGPVGKALLVIVDACRDNPILDQFTSNQTQIAGLSAQQKSRLAIGYISSRPDKYDQLYSNIMFLFATRPGKPAQSGTLASPNWFSEHLFAYMQDTSNDQMAIPLFIVDFESKAKRAQSGVPDYQRQIPQHIGSMASSPVFCFIGCAQPLSVWTNERVELITQLDTPVYFKSSGTLSRKSSTIGMIRVATVSVSPRPAADEQLAISSSAISRPLNLDVFYCAGDAQEQQRKEAARAFAESTRRAAPRDLVLANTFINQIRLRSLDINVNLAMQHPKINNSLILPKSSTASSAWMARLRGDFDRAYEDDVTKGYIRAYFCAGFSGAQKPRPLVYTQVAHADQIEHARYLVSMLSNELSELKFIEKIEPVDDTHPGAITFSDSTEIRCFGAEPCLLANHLATDLRLKISSPVVVVKMRSVASGAATNPVIELWFGKKEMASWANLTK